jgi:two-component system nitrogen regulation response regulator NtrX
LVLIVEDVAALREQYAYDLARLRGYETHTANDVEEGLAALDEHAVDCVLLDLEMPGADGFEFLRRVAERPSVPPILVYTGTGNYERCVRAVKLGAYGFLDKGEPMERVVQEIDNALERSTMRNELDTLRVRLDGETALLGDSEAMQAVRRAIDKLAAIPSPVLIVGESGTGKEIVARELHRRGPRRSQPFLAVNCAALPENLVESELFGHERGAFTGAERVRKGAFESAGAGTLFLDEIGELPQPVQAKLLRVLEQDCVTRLGGSTERPVAARVVAATNRDLDGEVEAGRFRQDLLFRLNVHGITVPPLSARRSDVPVLSAHFLATTARRFGARPKTITADALERLCAHDFRRNHVRELRNVIERLVLATDGATITPDVVARELGTQASAASGTSRAPATGTLRERKDEAERRILIEALDHHAWHLTNTAADLGLADHASLSKMLKRLGIERP